MKYTNTEITTRNGPLQTWLQLLLKHDSVYTRVSYKSIKHQKYSCLHCAASISKGQYGHLNIFVLFLDIFKIDCLQRTWPQDINIGGLSSVACSLETGQTKIEWNWNSRSNSTSTGNWFIDCHSCFFPAMTFINLRRGGKTWTPAATVTLNGLLYDCPKRLQNCLLSSSANLSQLDADSNAW